MEYEKLGSSAKDVASFLSNSKSAEGVFAKAFAGAKKPLIIVGSAVLESKDGEAVLKAVAEYVGKNSDKFITPEWNGYSVLQRAASRSAAYDIGFTPTASSSKATPKFVYLLNADEFDPKSIPENAFVVYQGHHGDVGAQYADVCLPGSAYTEKSTTWVNTEGRSQMGRTAVPPPGAAREDWKVLRALSEVLGTPLPYDDVLHLRDRMWDISPTLVRYDNVETPSAEVQKLGLKSLADVQATASGEAFKKPVANFYQTNPIARASVTMAACTKAFVTKDYKIQDEDSGNSQAAFA